MPNATYRAPLLLVTGRGDEKRAQRIVKGGRRAGPGAKPFVINRLIEKVKDVAGNRIRRQRKGQRFGRCDSMSGAVSFLNQLSPVLRSSRARSRLRGESWIPPFRDKIGTNPDFFIGRLVN